MAPSLLIVTRPCTRQEAQHKAFAPLLWATWKYFDGSQQSITMALTKRDELMHGRMQRPQHGAACGARTVKAGRQAPAREQGQYAWASGAACMRAFSSSRHACLVVVDQLVHAARAQGGAHCVSQRLAGVDVADQLRFTLTSIRALSQQDDLRLLRGARKTAGKGAISPRHAAKRPAKAVLQLTITIPIIGIILRRLLAPEGELRGQEVPLEGDGRDSQVVSQRRSWHD